MDVAVVTVGDELLSGDTQNTNATWLGRRLTERGATVARGVVIPDDVDEIERTVRALADRYDAVVVTGGLGPTHDDVTMDGVAAAFDRELDEHPDAADWFETESEYTGDLHPGTTHLPVGSRMLPNEVGVAPGCVVESRRVYVLPGVPAEMEAMFDRVADEFTGQRRHVETVYVDAAESELVDVFTELQERFDVGVGSYPGDGIRVKIQSTDPDATRRAADWLTDHVDAAHR